MASKRIIQSVFSKRLMSTKSESAARYVSPTSTLGEVNHKVTRLEQYMLVWNGRFKSVAEVPALVSRDTMERARNFFRIRLNLTIAALTVVGSMLMVISGKNAASRGDSLQKQNLDWHRHYNEEHAVDFNNQHH